MFILPLLGNTLEKERGNRMAKKEKPIKLEELSQEEKVKYEIAEELGLLEQVMNEGWKSLSSKETGRIGGILARRKRRENSRDKSNKNVN